MKLYLVRHGIAEDAVEASLNGRSDPLRALTKEGREKTNLVAKKFSAFASSPEIILHSPLVRAKETAQIFHKYFGEAVIQEVGGIRPNDEPSEGLQLMEAYASKVSVMMIVGHEPHLSYLASLLLTGSLKHPIPFKRAGIACFNWRGAGASELNFLVTPKILLSH